MNKEEAIKELNTFKLIALSESGYSAINTAIDTMRKYQKIEQILKDIPYGGDVTVRRIQEVIEDGKID